MEEEKDGDDFLNSISKIDGNQENSRRILGHMLRIL